MALPRDDFLSASPNIIYTAKICKTGDLFSEDRQISKIRDKDILSVNDAGACCYAMGGAYNLRPVPAEVILERDTFFLSRRRQRPAPPVSLLLEQRHSMSAPDETAYL